MSLNQITDWIGKEVTVEITGNKTVKGTLAFFNYNCQVVHIKDYVIRSEDKTQTETGQFIIINQNDWKNLKKR